MPAWLRAPGDALRELFRLAACAAYRVSLLVHPPKIAAAPAPAPRVSPSPSPADQAPAEYDGDTRAWVARVMSGSLEAPFPAGDPEAAHDVVRVRGVLPALARMHRDTGSPLALACVGELLRHTARLADRRPDVGWDSSTAALRLLSILDAAEVLRIAGRGPIAEPWLASFVAAHGRALAAGILCEPAGNHQFVNAAGRAAHHLLLRGGPLPAALAGDVGRRFALQLLADGGHVERSPHYHLQVLALAQLVARADAARGGSLSGRLDPAMRHARAALRKLMAPDGTVARFSDASRSFSGRHPRAEAALALDGGVASDGGGETVLDEFGIGRWRWGSAAHRYCLFVDTGPLGMRRNPGHGHADMLSLALYVDGAEVVADPGTFLYADTPEAMWFKRPEAHNTISWTGLGGPRLTRFFRWRAYAPAPAARGPDARRRHAGAAILRYPASHSHHRAWSLLADGVEVTDTVRAPAGAVGTSRLLLHPDCSVVGLSERGALVRSPGATLRVSLQGAPAGRVRVDEGWYAPAYGVRRPAAVLAWPVAGTPGGATSRARIEVLA